VSIDFVLKNNGKKTVVVKEMETSCMCTTAEVISGEQTSHKVGMRGHGYAHDIFMAIEPGEEALVKVTFDPNAHGPNGTGINRRSVYLETNSSINSKIKLDFQANVFRTSAELPEQEALSLAEDEFDFGLIKQSGGKVNHEFTLTYNGDEDIKITGVPTSCGCTSASIDKQTLSKGDTAKVIVTFNPNLHAEPEGKFFKTVSILTEPTLGESPEIKIWAEIDLDLGPEAFELQSDHDEDEEEEHDEPTYNSITPAVFSEMLENKDFVLIDVHIPEQSHIAGTDKFIPFDEIENNLTKLPQNKNEKIVVYCRSGSMSRAAAYTLAEMGYSNVYDLAGGKNAYDEYLD
jgi:rhodanese-related sulfurtransferase